VSAFPPRYETLDSLALAKGRQWSSHTAKSLEYMRLRLRRKEQGILCVPWPRDPGYEGNGNTTEFLSTHGWRRVVNPLPVPKTRVAANAVAVLTYRASAQFIFQVCSRARPFDNTLSATATGNGLGDSGTDYNVDDATGRIQLRLLLATDEEISVFARCKVTGTQNLNVLGLCVTALRSGVA
jgi:hypothetical protein